jgi:hypothetical protein
MFDVRSRIWSDHLSWALWPVLFTGAQCWFFAWLFDLAGGPPFRLSISVLLWAWPGMDIVRAVIAARKPRRLDIAMSPRPGWAVWAVWAAKIGGIVGLSAVISALGTIKMWAVFGWLWIAWAAGASVVDLVIALDKGAVSSFGVPNPVFEDSELAGIDSTSKAEALRKRGFLDLLLLLPRELGGNDDPRNVVYVPPAYAMLKRGFDLNEILSRGATRYEAVPEFVAGSTIPQTIRINASTQDGTIESTFRIWGRSAEGA